MKTFKMRHRFFRTGPVYFDESTAPTWLTSENSVKGSTMDERWFWDDYVLKLKIDESINTDFQEITRLT